jgi:hypothetical protein
VKDAVVGLVGEADSAQDAAVSHAVAPMFVIQVNVAMRRTSPWCAPPAWPRTPGPHGMDLTRPECRDHARWVPIRVTWRFARWLQLGGSAGARPV